MQVGRQITTGGLEIMASPKSYEKYKQFWKVVDDTLLLIILAGHENFIK